MWKSSTILLLPAKGVSCHLSTELTQLGTRVELLEAVRKSLRAKVVALEEDQWMYEAGDQGMRR